MTKLYIKTDEVKDKVIPHLTEAINKLNNAVILCNNIVSENEEYKEYIKNISNQISVQRKECESVRSWLLKNIESYNFFCNENAKFISETLVEGVDPKKDN